MTKLLKNKQAGFWLGPFQIIVHIFFHAACWITAKTYNILPQLFLFLWHFWHENWTLQQIPRLNYIQVCPTLEESGFDGTTSKFIDDSYTVILESSPGHMVLLPWGHVLCFFCSYLLIPVDGHHQEGCRMRPFSLWKALSKYLSHMQYPLFMECLIEIDGFWVLHMHDFRCKHRGGTSHS